MIGVVIAIACVVIIIILYGWSQFLLDRFYNMPPGPFPLPFIGNIRMLSKFRTRCECLSSLTEEYGNISTFYTGQTRMIVLNGPKEVHEGIVSQGKITSHRPIDFTPGFKGVPTGVLLSSGEKWQSLRRFSLRVLRDFGMGKQKILDNIHEEVGFLLDEWDQTAVNRPFDAQRLLQNSVSNVVSILVFGKRFEYGDPVFHEFMELVNDLVTNTFGVRFSQKVISMAPVMRFFIRNSRKEDFQKFQREVGKLLKKAVEEHRQDFSSDFIRDFPDVYIQMEMTEDGIDIESFANLSVDLFAAGTETTATLLNWTLLYLCLNPAIQKRCHDEIDKVIDSNRLPDSKDRSRLVYIDAVLNEAMRVATIVPTALFHCNGNDVVKIGGYDIPERSILVYNVWRLHHDPQYWNDPNIFNPDRFIDEDGKLLTHSSHFMPFGVGPRICLGENLAKMEGFVFLVSLLQRFSFRLPEGCTVDMNKSVSGITHAPPPFKLITTRR